MASAFSSVGVPHLSALILAGHSGVGEVTRAHDTGTGVRLLSRTMGARWHSKRRGGRGNPVTADE